VGLQGGYLLARSFLPSLAMLIVVFFLRPSSAICFVGLFVGEMVAAKLRERVLVRVLSSDRVDIACTSWWFLLCLFFERAASWRVASVLCLIDAWIDVL
jgi:hypothetical protein